MRKLNAAYATVQRFFFIHNVVDLTISPIKKELDLHVGSDGGLKEDGTVIEFLLLLLLPFLK